MVILVSILADVPAAAWAVLLSYLFNARVRKTSSRWHQVSSDAAFSESGLRLSLPDRWLSRGMAVLIISVPRHVRVQVDKRPASPEVSLKMVRLTGEGARKVPYLGAHDVKPACHLLHTRSPRNDSERLWHGKTSIHCDPRRRSLRPRSSSAMRRVITPVPG